jgi:hypothetical protein
MRNNSYESRGLDNKYYHLKNALSTKYSIMNSIIYANQGAD